MMLLDVGTPMGELKIFDVNIPIDEKTTLVKFVALRTFFKGKWADRDARRRVFKVLYEDQAVVDKVRPELLPFDLSAELHVKSDYNAVLYRRRRQELIESGWGVEGNTIVGEGPARVEAAGHPVADPQGGARARQRVELQGGPQPGDPARQRPSAQRAATYPAPTRMSSSRRIDHRGDQGMSQPVRNPVPRHPRHHRRARRPDRGDRRRRRPAPRR